MNPRELVFVVAGVAIVAVLAFIMFRGAKRIQKEYKARPQRKITLQHWRAAVGCFWATTIYALKFWAGINDWIAIPLTTLIAIIAYYVGKKEVAQK